MRCVALAVALVAAACDALRGRVADDVRGADAGTGIDGGAGIDASGIGMQLLRALVP